MKNESSRVYYLSTLRESSTKRIKRIVFQSTSKTSMSQTKSPEEQKSAKFSQVACLNEDTCSSGTGAIACEQTLLFGRAKRVSRERASERRSREGPLARAFSRARLARPNRRACSQATDANADLPGGANPAAPEPKQNKPKKKCSRKRQRTSDEAHIAHMEMWQGCENDE